jgi:hypothetical protein
MERKQCEWYAISYDKATGDRMESMFPSEMLLQDETERCPSLAVDYIITPCGQVVYLCAEHYDKVISDDGIAEYDQDTKDWRDAPFTQ